MKLCFCHREAVYTIDRIACCYQHYREKMIFQHCYLCDSQATHGNEFLERCLLHATKDMVRITHNKIRKLRKICAFPNCTEQPVEDYCDYHLKNMPSDTLLEKSQPLENSIHQEKIAPNTQPQENSYIQTLENSYMPNTQQLYTPELPINHRLVTPNLLKLVHDIQPLPVQPAQKKIIPESVYYEFTPCYWCKDNRLDLIEKLQYCENMNSCGHLCDELRPWRYY